MTPRRTFGHRTGDKIKAMYNQIRRKGSSGKTQSQDEDNRSVETDRDRLVLRRGQCDRYTWANLRVPANGR